MQYTSVQSQKWQNDLCWFPRQVNQYHSNRSICPNDWWWRSWGWTVLWRPTRPSRTNTKTKDVLFIIGDWNWKAGSQKIHGITGKFSLGVQNEARQRLTKFCQENTLVIANTLFQQHKRWLYTWTSPDHQCWNHWLYSLQPEMETLYTVSKNKTRSWLWLGSWTPYCNFRLKSKKVGKTTRPFRYDLNQIPYDYSVEVTNRFKGLDLIDRVPDELWNEVLDIVQETGFKTITMEKKCKNA